MNERPSDLWFSILSPVLTIAVLVFYLLTAIFTIPYIGLKFSTSTGKVTLLFPAQAGQEPGLQVGDQLLQVGELTLEQYRQDPLRSFFGSGRAGQVLSIRINRQGQELTIPWVLPGRNTPELLNRLLYLTPPFIFWIIGLLTVLILRPRDVRWRLLAAFNFLLAVWVMAGMISPMRAAGSSIVLHASAWLFLPVALHLHWVFPQPLAPARRQWFWALYAGGLVLLVAELLGLIPLNSYLIGFLLALPACLALLALHARNRPEQRGDILLIGIACGLIFLPAMILSLARLKNVAPGSIANIMFFLPALPLVYLLVAYRRHLEWLEVRTNRAVSLGMYSLLQFSLFLLVAILILAAVPNAVIRLTIGVLLASLAMIVSVLVFPAFERAVERRLLGIPLPVQDLPAAFMAQITTSLEAERLARLFREEIFPSLLIRQAALLRISPPEAGSGDEILPLALIGVAPEQLPGPADLPALFAETGLPRSAPPLAQGQTPCPWARLALALKIDNRPVGLCLLGRRDPEDRYARREIPALQTLMDQAALALANIEQAERMRRLYQAAIDREEAERARLARELHDEVLNDMAVLAANLDETRLDQAVAAYQAGVRHIRAIISGLRPNLLSQGLYGALQELVDESADQVSPALEVRIELAVTAPVAADYPPEIAQHLYRIVQQACQNALKHARASRIRISGALEPGSARLVVEDDGIGFAAGENLDLSRLLAEKHFGLASMHERAALINARLSIQSSPGRGTRIEVLWEENRNSQAECAGDPVNTLG